MPSERITIDPVTEDPTLVPLDFVGIDPSWGIYLLAHDYPPPKIETQRAGSVDTEGDPVVQSKYGNRTIPVRLRIVEPEDPASTNLAPNPFAALATTSWAGVGLLAGPTRIASPGATPDGIGCDTGVEAKTDAAGDALYHGAIGVTTGKTYRASVYCLLTARTGAAKARIVVYNAAGEVKAVGEELTASSLKWVRLNVQFTADSTAEWRVGVEQAEAGTMTFFLTGVLVELDTSTVRTNLIANPLARVANTGWTGESLVSGPTRVTPGTMPAAIVGATTALEAAGNADQDRMLAAVPVASLTAGKTYRASVYVRMSAATGGAGIRLSLRKYLLGPVQANSPTTKVIGEWLRLDLTWVAAELESQRLCVEQVGAGTVTFAATGFLFEESAELGNYYPSPAQLEAGEAGWKGAADNASSYILSPLVGPGPFFCGDTPGCDWTGTRHASTATRPAPNGTRFSRIYRDVTRKLDRIVKDKAGTYRRIAPGFAPITYDLRVAEVTDAPQDISIGMKRAEIGLAFEALSFGRQAEQLVAEVTEEALPANIFTALIPGDVPALGRLVLEDRQAQNQQVALWGQQNATYDPAATAKLFYEAEALTPLGTATTGALVGASGGSTLRHTALVGSYQGVMSTKLLAGNHLTHTGTYRVLARLYRPEANLGEVTAMFLWSEGDFLNTTENDPVVFQVNESEGVFTIADMGIVELSGERWEGRVVAKSTSAGDDLHVDWLMFIPVDEGSGRLEASLNLDPPAELSVADAFNQGAGAATGKSPDLGAVYSAIAGSDATDFEIDATTHRLKRNATVDTGAISVSHKGRGLTTGLEPTAVVMMHDFDLTQASTEIGVPGPSGGHLVSYVNETNLVVVALYCDSLGKWRLSCTKNNGQQLAPISRVLHTGSQVTGTMITYVRGNRLTCYIGLEGAEPEAIFTAENALIGVKGKCALYDNNAAATAANRYYDNLAIWVPLADAAVFASRTAVVLSDRVRRRSEDNTTWGKIPYDGDYLLVPESGPEQQPTRFITKLVRNTDIDTGIDDQRSSLYVQPRWLLAPPT